MFPVLLRIVPVVLNRPDYLSFLLSFSCSQIGEPYADSPSKDWVPGVRNSCLNQGSGGGLE